MAKTIKEKIEVMTAYEECKKIKCFNKYGVEVCIYDKSRGYEPSWDWLDYDYIIVEEEPKYRPYADTEEMINDFCERSGAKRSKMGEPFIWVKKDESKYLILDFEKDKVWTNFNSLTMQELFEIYTYCDETPIGKKE